MVDLKLGSTTYSGIDRVQISKADSSGVVNFTPSDVLFAALQGEKVGGLYENPYLVTLSKPMTLISLAFDTVYLPNVVGSSVVYYGGANSVGCKRFIAPKLTKSAQLSWGGDVQIMDFTDMPTIEGYGISGTKLHSVILRKDTMVTLAEPDHQGNVTQTIYVPSSLLSAYQADSNWSQLLSKGRTFAAIEGSAYENTDWFRTAV